ncbi:MAG: ABC transporter substrate-binding protein [Gammaproteobacteria bacterium]|nr:ABC transporter substrate-binding protein [Gammaproteobacteria bacterium]
MSRCLAHRRAPAACRPACLPACRLLLLPLLLPAGGCTERPWNDPYPSAPPLANILYDSFTERPKHLDPARAYSADEYQFIAQIYEPPLQYHFLHRPYRLAPLAAAEMPVAEYLDEQGRPLPASAPPERIAYSRYRIRIREGIRYQPHPALARDAAGRLRFHRLRAQDLRDVHALADFPASGSRELNAGDYVYQVKRLAHPATHSPIAGLLSRYIVGFRELGETLGKEARRLAAEGEAGGFQDLRRHELEGARQVDRYRYEITLHGRYPQFLYWLAMPFFSPMPWEAERFYAQSGMQERNLALDWYPLGTGPFLLAENNPNRRMVLERNPNFRGEPYPAEGEPEDRGRGFLADAGRPMPFLEQAIYTLEKEAIPAWSKFLQGYYDASGIVSDSFDQAIEVGDRGGIGLSEEMRARGIGLLVAVTPSSYYMGFNMRDPVVGGRGERARRLRHAVAIAVDYEEYVSIFLNGRGIVAQGPIPPGIFGYLEGERGLNPVTHYWRDGAARRRPLEDARRLLAEAGYPEGRDPATGRPLVLYFDTVARGPDSKARYDWLGKQFAKLGIQLVVRGTDYNRFREKMRQGTAQLFQWGWNADYPDPENFLFLLYGPHAKVDSQGENSANYGNPEFDRLFDRMRDMENGPQRLEIIGQMTDLVRHDAPWLWGFHPKAFSLHHAWYGNAKPNLMANNTLKYRRVNPELRTQARQRWNRPLLWPVLALAALLAAVAVPAVRLHRARERAVAR